MSQKINPYLSKDFNWLQLKSTVIKTSFLADELVVLVVLDRATAFLEKESASVITCWCFFPKNGLPRFLATIVNLRNNAWVHNNLDLFLTQ